MSTATRITRRPRSRSNGRLPPAVPPLPVHRFTIEEYHKLAQTGVLTENDRVELIHGWIVPKRTLNPPHAYSVTALMEQLLALGTNAIIRVQQPITTTDSEPEPDIVLATGSKSEYKKRYPYPAEISIVVEVADSSLLDDRTTKRQLYAAARIAVHWIVNLIDRRVEVYTEPRGGKNPAYKKQKNYSPSETVPVVVAGKELGRIAVKELLP